MGYSESSTSGQSGYAESGERLWFLLQEEGDFILLEEGGGFLALEPEEQTGYAESAGTAPGGYSESG